MQIKKFSLRFSLVFIFLLACLFGFAVKLILIQIFRSTHLASLAERQHNHTVEIEPVRGTIYDRNLRPLALNVSVYSLFANPREMSQESKNRLLQVLPKLIDVDRKLLSDRLSKKKYFVWLKRKLSADTVKEIRKLKIKGLGFMDETKRYYPNQDLAAHVIGFAGIDNEGLEGIELFYDKYLRGEKGLAQILRDAKQRDLMIEKSYIPARDGMNLILTLDETIQFLAEQALEKAYRKHNAISGSIIVMNIKTGEILALANRPTYSLTHASDSPIENRTNRAVTFMYEPGSVFKIVAASAALEEKAFIESDKIYCENGEYRVANHTLHDHGKHGTLTFREVFEVSSNIGVTKISQKLGPDLIYKYGQRFRFGMKTGIDLKGEINGLFKNPSKWSKTSIGAIPIGHEVGATPIQLVSALAAIANNGVYMKPYVVKEIRDSYNQVVKSFEPQAVDRVISEDTAKRLNEILVGVVETGTGRKAMINGMRVAGKTGTAQKVINGIYSHDKFYSTFFGYAPADDPQIAVIVVFDDPHPSYFGGTVAAPVFKEVVENSLKYLKNTGSDFAYHRESPLQKMTTKTISQ